MKNGGERKSQEVFNWLKGGDMGSSGCDGLLVHPGKSYNPLTDT